MASITSGMGFPPRMSMPSMSNANTNESSGGTSPRVTGVPGVAGAGAGNESASRLTVASSSPAAPENHKSSGGRLARYTVMNLGGTTTTDPFTETTSFVAVIDDNRRTPATADGGIVRSSCTEAILAR